MGFWKDAWEGLTSPGTRESRRKFELAVERARKDLEGCGDDYCTLDPKNPSKLLLSHKEMSKDDLKKLEDRIAKTMASKGQGFHASGMVMTPRQGKTLVSPRVLEGQLSAGQSISIVLPDDAECTEIQTNIDGETVKFIRADKAIPLDVHTAVCKLYNATAVENERLKEQLQEFRTFKDDETDGVDLA